MKKISLLKWVVPFLACICYGVNTQAQVIVTLQVNQAAQLAADAGMDQLICEGDSAVLGGIVPQTGGTAPYTYAWSPTNDVANPTAANTLASPPTSQDYILTITDANNCSTSDTITVTVNVCVGIQGQNWVTDFKVIPNPNQGDFTLRMFSAQSIQGVSLNLINLLGESVFKSDLGTVSGNFETQVSLPNLAGGIYFLNLTGSDWKLTKKVILQ